MSVTTLAEFKHFLQIDETDTSQDTLLQELLDRAEAKVQNYLSTKFYASDATPDMITEDLDADNKIIYTKYQPFIEVTSITLDGDTLTEDSDYYVYDNYIYLLVLSDTPQVLEVQYTAGFVGLPDDIKQSVILTASNYIKLNTELKPEQSIDYRMPKEAKDLLFPYLRLEI